MCEVETAKTTPIISAMIEQLLLHVWRGVADKNIAKMAPETIKNQTDHAMQSFVYQSYAEKLKSKNKIKIDLDPISTAKDNYAFGVIQTQKRTVRKLSKDMQPSLFGERSRSMISDIEKVSVTSGNLKGYQQNIEKSVEKSKRQTFFVSLGYQEEAEDKQLVKLRKIQGEKQAEQIKSKRMLQEKLIQQKNKAQAQEKMLRQKGVFTYDYEGLCCGISPGKDQSDMVPKMKQILGNQEVKSKGHIAVEPTSIQNDKLLLREEMTNKSQHSKQKPEFAEKSFSLAEVLADQEKISEGVKIIELRNNNNNLILQNKQKRKEAQQPYRLKDYKSLTKQKSFVEFSLTSTSKKNSLYELSKTPSLNDTIGDTKTKTLRVDRSTPKHRERLENQCKASQTHSMLSNVLGRGLPFIRTKGLRFYDIESTNTFRTLEPNSTSRKSSKIKSSRIKIDDSDLFEQTILN